MNKTLSLISCLSLMVSAVTVSRIALAEEVQTMDEESATAKQYHFRVFVDDIEVGTHRYDVDQRGGQQHVNSVADFKYKWSFVTLYDYQHQNHEIWSDGCLARIESSTDANGEDYSVSGEQSDQGFVVNGKSGKQLLPACIMTFAYWDPKFLEAGKLLNSQNGEYLDVNVAGPEPDVLQMYGQEHQASRYQLTAGKLDLQLWYSDSGEWLGLQSRTESGRMLRYELLPAVEIVAVAQVAQQ